METLVLNGKSYVKASKAARDLGYTADYVGQLCRGGKVDAHLVGRTWYVDASMLGEHRVEKKRMSRIKAREQVHKSLEEHKLKIANTKNDYKNIGIRYSSDDGALMPETRKLSVENDKVHAKARAAAREDDAPLERYSVENEGEKVIMSGSVRIEDANEDAIDSDTTLLSPKLVRHSTHTSTADADASRTVSVSPEAEIVEMTAQVPKRKSFLERIELVSPESNVSTEAISAQAEESKEEAVETVVTTSSTVESAGSVLPHILFVVIITVLSVCSIGVIQIVTYHATGQMEQVRTDYVLDMQDAITDLSLKI